MAVPEADRGRAGRQVGQRDHRLEQAAARRGGDAAVLRVGVAAVVVARRARRARPPRWSRCRAPRRPRPRRRAARAVVMGLAVGIHRSNCTVRPPVLGTRRHRSRRRPARPGSGRARRPGPTGRRRSAGRSSTTARSGSRSARKSPAAMPATTRSSSTRIMSSPIIMSAPPTASDPAAVVVDWVAMARRKKAGLSSMRSSTPRIRPAQPLHRRGAVVDHEGDGVLQAVVHGLHAGAQELVAVGEVDVDGRAGDAGLGGDLVHGDVGGAALAEEAARRVDDLVAPEVADDVLQRIGRAPGHRLLRLAQSAGRLRRRRGRPG